MPEQPFLEHVFNGKIWVEVRDGNDTVRSIYDRHYSRRRYADGRKPKKFVGPGEYMTLLTPDTRAIFVWRKFLSDDGQSGVNCAVFRNEGVVLSSHLIREADRLAFERWPGLRHYTYVDWRKVRSRNPGYCFLRAGWRRCGRTKRGLIILERIQGREEERKGSHERAADELLRLLSEGASR